MQTFETMRTMWLAAATRLKPAFNMMEMAIALGSSQPTSWNSQQAREQLVNARLANFRSGRSR